MDDDTFNADSLLSQRKQRETVMNKSFNMILEKCHKRIIYANKIGLTTCDYLVPEFVVGFPIYDIKECIIHIMYKLRDEKFHVEYKKPRTLSISWSQSVSNSK